MKRFHAALMAAAMAWPLMLGAEAAPGPQAVIERLLGRQFLRDLGGDKAKRSIRGTRALWVDLSVQKPDNSEAFKGIEADLKASDIEAQLKEAGLRVMDPKKRSLAIGLRPTLSLMVLRSPSGAEGLDKGFYVVVASAIQDVTPLGGDTLSTPTWVKAGEAIVFSGDDLKDAGAIRAAARALVGAFIDAARGAKAE